VIEDQKIVVGGTTTTKCARKSWAQNPAHKSSFIQCRNDDYLNDLRKFEKGKRKVVSPFSFFKSFLFIFEFFWFYQMQRWEKTNMQWKRRKENGGFGGERKNSNANGERRVEKKMG
jgi:hypothetical protein